MGPGAQDTKVQIKEYDGFTFYVIFVRIVVHNVTQGTVSQTVSCNPLVGNRINFVVQTSMEKKKKKTE